MMERDPVEQPRTPYRGQVSVPDAAVTTTDLDDPGALPAVRCVAFVRTLLRAHHAMLDGRCACGHPPSVCHVRVIARAHGIPVDPALRAGLRTPPASGRPDLPGGARHRLRAAG